MNALWEFLDHPLAGRIGWVLLHSIWQGCLVGAAFAALRQGLRRHSANVRYVAGCLALALLLAGPIVTVMAGWTPSFRISYSSPTVVFQSPQLSPALEGAAIETSSGDSTFWFVRNIVDFLGHAAPVLAGLWLLGVIICSCRLAQSWWWVRRLRTRENEPVDAAWVEVLNDLRRRLEISRPVLLVKSALVEVPAVAGWLRPVILLPAATLAGLTPDQLEAILAHELAHVRRLDFLVNAAQCVVETVMFYHPIVWWISRCVREERENCCDDLVVSVCGNRVTYARALSRLEEFRADLPGLAFAVSGGSLLHRIRRLLGAPGDDGPASARELSGLTLLGTGLLLIILGVYLMAVPNSYRAVARVKVEHDQSDVSDLINKSRMVLEGDSFSESIRQDVTSIQSEDILRKVIDDLGLKAEWGKTHSRGEPLPMQEAIRRFRSKLEVHSVRNTSLLEICVVADTPQEAAKIANALAEAYVAHSLEQSRKVIQKGLASLQERFSEGDEKVKAAQARVDLLRKELNIPYTSDSSEASSPSLTADTLRRMEGLRIEAEAALAREETLARKLQELQAKDFDALIQVLPTTEQDTLLVSLLEQQTGAEQKLLAAERDFGPTNSELIKARKNVEYLSTKITNRVDGIIAGLLAKVASDKASLEGLKANVVAARQRDIDEANRRQPYWDAKRDLAELVAFRKTLDMKLAEEKMDYSLPGTSPVEIVDQAVPPLQPFAPNRYRAAALIVLGILLDLSGLWLLKRPPVSKTGRPLLAVAAS